MYEADARQDRCGKEVRAHESGGATAGSGEEGEGPEVFLCSVKRVRGRGQVLGRGCVAIWAGLERDVDDG